MGKVENWENTVILKSFVINQDKTKQFKFSVITGFMNAKQTLYK